MALAGCPDYFLRHSNYQVNILIMNMLQQCYTTVSFHGTEKLKQDYYRPYRGCFDLSTLEKHDGSILFSFKMSPDSLIMYSGPHCSQWMNNNGKAIVLKQTNDGRKSCKV